LLNDIHKRVEAKDYLLRDVSGFIPFDNINDSTDTFIGKIRGISIQLRHSLDFEQIEKVYRASFRAHEVQKRKSGDPYIIHPVMVAVILAKLKQDTMTICAALLHDVVEDTSFDLYQVENLFGQELADVVDGVTKVTITEEATAAHPAHKERQIAETYRKMILATSRNPRTIMVKLADRLHNLSTLDSLSPEKQKRIADETLDIYAPLAAEMGVYTLKSKLEDISMEYAYPNEYKQICERIDLEHDTNAQIIEFFLNKINETLQANGIDGYEATGRVKSVHSIFKKHIDREVPYDEIYDVLGCRIVCKNELDCYKVLGLLHGIWCPIGDKIKDYIALPKDNGYKSLHTTLVDDRTGHQVEIQIRTWKMNLEAEYGLAAHNDYKGDSKKIRLLDEFPVWEKEFTDSEEFLNVLKSGIGGEEITIYIQKDGKSIKLPGGATVLDLAYYWNKQSGNKCSGAIINGKIMPISRRLYNNETVKIMTSTDSKPSVEWLSIAKTPIAKTAIKKYLQQMEIDDKTDRAFNLLIGAHEHLSKPMSFDKYREEILKFFGFSDEKTLFDKIYSGEITTDNILDFTKTLTQEDDMKKFANLIDGGKDRYNVLIDSSKKSNTIRFGVCCNPLPGDKIIGFNTGADRGISIHRDNCEIAFVFADDKERVVHCGWAQSGDFGMFPQELTILGLDKSNVFMDIAKVLEAKDIKLENWDFRKGNGVSKILIFVKIKNIAELNLLIKSLKKINGVSSVHRNLPVKRFY